jgi:hypothetical protein
LFGGEYSEIQANGAISNLRVREKCLSIAYHSGRGPPDGGGDLGRLVAA